jgi:hypothetical protein
VKRLQFVSRERESLNLGMNKIHSDLLHWWFKSNVLNCSKV